MGYYPRTHAVFGAMRDKDLATMIDRLLPLVEHWHLPQLPIVRAADPAELRALIGQRHELLLQRGAMLPPHCTVEEHADPTAALRVAVEQADPADRIVVFGSFYTVGGVLAQGLPRRAARHLG